MSERRDLGFPMKSACSLREQLARTTLQTFKSQGHTYVDLREDGKRFIFFCTLCLAPCYSDSVLLDHLKGNLHKERLAAANATLFGPNPWPFDDGVHFFDNSSRTEKNLAISNGSQQGSLECCCDDNNLAIVRYDGNLQEGSNGNNGSNGVSGAENLNVDGLDSDLVLPCVLIKEKLVDVRVKLTGLGQISARFFQKDGSTVGISRIWCEWLGEIAVLDEDVLKTPEHDFAIVTFAYNYELGRTGFLEDTKYLLTFGQAEPKNSEDDGRKRKRSVSEPEDATESYNHYDSSEEGSSASNSTLSRLLVDQKDDQLLHMRFITNKAIRRELRRQQQLLAERMCDICQQKMLPGKDVAAIMNLKTGKLVCSSRNMTGAFHVFHTSCLIHWILLCELEINANQLVSPKERPKSSKKSVAKKIEKGKNRETNGIGFHISCVLCPQCQGTGTNIEEGQLEKDTVPLSQMFRYKIKVSDARKAWMKSPEKLQNCSTGFHFPSRQEHAVEEKVIALKLLRFYRAGE